MGKQDRPILVYGATGRQGRAVVQSLLSRGQAVRALVRDEARADSLSKAGVEIAVGDFTKPSTLEAATEGVDSVFLVLPLECSKDLAVAYGRTAIDAAKNAGVGHIVFSSGGPMPTEATRVALIESKRDVERYLLQSGIPNTLLRPAPFMDNFAAPWSATLIAQHGVVAQSMPADLKVSYIAVDDIGALAAEAFNHPELGGSAFNIGGPEALSGKQVAERFTRILGRPVSYQSVPLEEFEKETNAQMGAPWGTELAKLSRWFADNGGVAFEMGPVIERLPVRLTTLEEWISRIQWPVSSSHSP